MLRLIKNTILGILIVSLMYSLSKNIFGYTDKLDFYHEYRKEYEKENELNKQLKSDLKRSKDYYFVEREIREKLNLLQPQEEAIILPKITITPTPPPAITPAPYKQWIDLIVH